MPTIRPVYTSDANAEDTSVGTFTLKASEASDASKEGAHMWLFLSWAFVFVYSCFTAAHLAKLFVKLVCARKRKTLF